MRWEKCYLKVLTELVISSTGEGWGWGGRCSSLNCTESTFTHSSLHQTASFNAAIVAIKWACVYHSCVRELIIIIIIHPDGIIDFGGYFSEQWYKTKGGTEEPNHRNWWLSSWKKLYLLFHIVTPFESLTSQKSLKQALNTYTVCT